MITKVDSRLLFVLLLAVIWIVCGTVAAITRKQDPLEEAGVVAMLLGLGWFLSHY